MAKVIVVGGGPAGIMAALTASKTNEVILVERIRQIEAKALRKLRHPSRSKKLKDYLD